MRNCDLFVILDTVQYRHQYFQNRNRIWGPIWVTVPILHPVHRPITEIEIAPDWYQSKMETYLGKIEETYRKAPYFKEMQEKLTWALSLSNTNLLCCLNYSLINWFRSEFGIETKLIRSSKLNPHGDQCGSDLILALCQEVGATTYLSGKLGRNYLNEEDFQQAGIELIYQNYTEPEYPHFTGQYQAGLSALDLLMCHGSGARGYL